jgi:tetratricopeptide (TPR) repeat protein
VASAAFALGGGEDGPAGEERGRRELARGLGHLLRARDLCPLIPETHLLLAANARRLAGAEAPGRYLERVRALAPTDPTLWYLCGRQELIDGQPDRAWSDWRRSLELSDRHLGDVLGTALKRLGPRGLLEQVLPDDPALLVRVGQQLDPDPGPAAGRRPFQERALDLLGRQPGAGDPDRLHLKASLQRALGRPAEALESYRAALARRPQEPAWWLEMGELLREQGRLQEARRALLEVVAQQPGDRRARELLESVELELAKGS